MSLTDEQRQKITQDAAADAGVTVAEAEAALDVVEFASYPDHVAHRLSDMLAKEPEGSHIADWVAGVMMHAAIIANLTGVSRKAFRQVAETAYRSAKKRRQAMRKDE